MPPPAVSSVTARACALGKGGFGSLSPARRQTAAAAATRPLMRHTITTGPHADS